MLEQLHSSFAEILLNEFCSVARVSQFDAPGIKEGPDQNFNIVSPLTNNLKTSTSTSTRVNSIMSVLFYKHCIWLSHVACILYGLTVQQKLTGVKNIYPNGRYSHSVAVLNFLFLCKQDVLYALSRRGSIS